MLANSPAQIEQGCFVYDPPYDKTSQVVSYREYDPYGNPLTTGSDSYGFTGEWFEADIGLLHLRARWYDPASGTFLSRDPFEGTVLMPASRHGYHYVHQNPTN